MKNGSYDLVVAPLEYTGKKYRNRYIQKSHLIWWNHTGEVVEAPYLIHHKNENIRDDRFENLEKKHIQKHNFEHNYIESIETKCTNCDKIIILRPSDYRYRKNKNKNGLFCSVRCSAIKQWVRNSM